MTAKVLVETSEHILTITFNRADKLNALDPESYHLLAQALYRLQHDDLRDREARLAPDAFPSSPRTISKHRVCASTRAKDTNQITMIAGV